MIGSETSPKGAVVFFRVYTPSLWADYEVNCAKIFAASLNLLDLDELENS